VHCHVLYLTSEGTEVIPKRHSVLPRQPELTEVTSSSTIGYIILAGVPSREKKPSHLVRLLAAWTLDFLFLFLSFILTT